MSETATPLTREQISTAIAEKAWKDEAFHAAVLTNANQVYKEFMGQPVPEGVTIRVVEDTLSLVHFVLPQKPANANELSDAELEAVAGGATPLGVAAVAAITFIGSFGIKAGLHATDASW